MKMSDPKHFDTILPFLQPTDVPHKIDLTVADIAKMHKDAGQDIDFLHTTSTIQTRSRAPALNADQIPSLSYPTDSEVIRDRTARTAKLVQAGYAERVLRTFGMWDCKPIHTPLDANSRLTKGDCPEVVDPILHRRYRSIAGSLSYLVNMTRPDLAFAYSQLSKFVQYPGLKHLEAVERVLQYVRATYDQGMTYFDPGSALLRLY